MTKSSIVALTAALFAVGGTAYAEEKPAFKEVDGNGDGKVSVEEAKKAGIPESEAKKEDLNNDGKLSKKDWKYVELDPKPAPGQGGGPSGSGGNAQPGGASKGDGPPGM